MRRLALAAVAAVALGVPAQAAPAPSGLPLDLSTKLTMDCLAPGHATVVADCGDILKTTFVEESMPATGKVTIGQTVFDWPTKALQSSDTMAASGQQLLVNGAKGWNSVAILCAFRADDEDGKGRLASVNVKYVDGTSERVSFRAYGWKHHRELSVFPSSHTQTPDPLLFDEGRLSKGLAPLNPKKPIKSIEMPSTSDPLLLVWAVSLSQEKAPVKP